MSVILYGISNCDTVKKARAWLDTHHVNYTFHDFKKAGVNEALLQRWITIVGWEALLNKRGTTWRKLPQTEQEHVQDAAGAIALMHQYPSVIKRPILENDAGIYVGFNLNTYESFIL